MGVPAFTAEHTKGVCQITFEISDEILYLIFDYPHKHYTFKHFEI